MQILSGDFLRQIILLEERMMTQQRTLNGRQLAFLIWDKFRRDADEVGLTEFFDLREVRLANDDLKRFILDWDDVMFGLLNDQDPKYLLSLFDEQVKRCTHFRQVYAAYNLKCTHEGLEHSYQNLRKWVQAHIDQRQREKVKSQLQSHPTGNRAAAAGVGGGGLSGKPPGAGKGRKGHCFKFLESAGKCSAGRDCPLIHDYEFLKSYVPRKGQGRGKSSKGKRSGSAPSGGGKGSGHKGRTPSANRDQNTHRSQSPHRKGKGKSGPRRERTPGPRTPRDNSQGVRGNLHDGRYTPSKSRIESRGKSPSGEKNRPPCVLFLNGNCQKGSKCNDWHVQDCKFYNTPLGPCTAGHKRCIWLHRDENGKILNLGTINAMNNPVLAAKAKAKARVKGKAAAAKAKAKAGVCVASEITVPTTHHTVYREDHVLPWEQ